jgi:L-ascorbate metabolism protein UlaG (beta-lactamase superfamily)
MMVITVFFSAFLLILLWVFLFLRGPRFGRLPRGASLARIYRSPHQNLGKFENLHVTPDLTEGANFFTVLRDVLFAKSKRSRPGARLPSIKTDLLHLDPGASVLVWFGHSSYFIQVDGKRFLVDPDFSGSASPIPATTRSFAGSDIYSTRDIPEIDFLLLSHDHWDHLDYQTIKSLKPKVKQVICSLGVSDHLTRWGYDPQRIAEKDWYQETTLDAGFQLSILPARHFSGRGFKRNRSLWVSFVLQTPTLRIYLGGDSGYDTHFAEIGKSHGPFDLAILECGQYNAYWRYIHMMPEETVQAAIDLGAKQLLPVHWAKFALGLHSWDEPILRARSAALGKPILLLHPMIGESVNLRGPNQFSAWWENLTSQQAPA